MADDLEELDILASQALSQCPAAARGASNQMGYPKVLQGETESAAVKDNFELELLQAQYKELKEKMKAMGEEVLIKNGEIKVLRDSLHQTESVSEEQRRSQFLLEQEKAQALGDRERDSPESSDAEMSELRTKLQCSERAHSQLFPPLPTAEKPFCGSKAGSVFSTVWKTIFPYKGVSQCQHVLPQPCPTGPGFTSRAGREENKTFSLGGDPTKQEESQKSLVGSLMRRSNTRGSTLINLLLKQPWIPGSALGLCQLLSCGSEVPSSTPLQPLGLGSTGAAVSGLRTTGSCDGSFPLSALGEAQSLALTGLNLVAREEDSCDGAPAEGGPGAFPLCQLPGAVHLLPLVQFFVGAHCQALQDSAAARRSGTPGGSGAEASAEDSLCSLESCCVASLGVLQHLRGRGPPPAVRTGVGSAAGEGSQSLRPPGEDTSAAGGLAGDQGRHPRLETLLRLLAFSSARQGTFRPASWARALRFQCVFPLLPRCLRPDVALPSVLLANHETLAPQLCSRSEGCLLPLLYADRAATDTQWLHLEQEACGSWLSWAYRAPCPRLLAPAASATWRCPGAHCGAAQTVVTVRRAGRGGAGPEDGAARRTVRCLRDAALLLHSRPRRTSASRALCGVLHQYDQAAPGVSALIRSLPDVTDCEEAALDDLCAAEPHADDPDTDLAEV
ncbi:LOW QUALITY PROTEIN: hypothetical protein QTO34_012881 [Cnephaeus nilssonii]|uniref:ATR-interacting protein n=1 Tax=Cnephaeus nilssonii TaxID=3371016 RepID=A0AA40HAB7_CNENI|nr:LOW QUALITY PROTEIN: hypothetical protein QTO34_012881 [Eptesicus nilssonii]